MKPIASLAIALTTAAVMTASFFAATDANAGCTRVYTQMGWQTRCK